MLWSPRRSAHDLSDAHRQLAAKRRDLEADLDAAGATADAHKRRGRFPLAERAREREACLQAELDALDAEHRRLGDAATARTLAAHELAQIRQLATDVPRLLAAADRHPALVREFLTACVRSVWVRRVAKSTFEIDVKFLNGYAVRHLVRRRSLHYTQPQRAWASARLAAGIAPDDVAAELNTVRVNANEMRFTSFRVRAAAAQYQQQAPTRSRLPRWLLIAPRRTVSARGAAAPGRACGGASNGTPTLAIPTCRGTRSRRWPIWRASRYQRCSEPLCGGSSETRSWTPPIPVPFSSRPGSCN